MHAHELMLFPKFDNDGEVTMIWYAFRTEQQRRYVNFHLHMDPWKALNFFTIMEHPFGNASSIPSNLHSSTETTKAVVWCNSSLWSLVHH